MCRIPTLASPPQVAWGSSFGFSGTARRTLTSFRVCVGLVTLDCSLYEETLDATVTSATLPLVVDTSLSSQRFAVSVTATNLLGRTVPG